MNTPPISLPPSMLAGQYLRNLIIAKGDLLGARAIAEGGNSIYRAELVEAFKSASSVGTTSSDSALVGRPVAFSFQAALRPFSAVEKIAPRVAKVPSSTRIMSFAGGTVGSEVTEGAPSPVTIGSLTSTLLKDRKFQATTVISAELAKLAVPGADVAIAADLAAAAAAAEDAAFIASMVTAAGANTLASTGSTAAEIDADVRTLVAFLTTAKSNLINAVLVISSTAATFLSTLRTSATDALAFPMLSIEGGTLAGLPVIVSASTTSALLLLDLQGLILTVGEYNLDVTGEASVQLDTAPDDPQTAATVEINLWQQNLAATRATVWRNWFARAGSVAAITGLGF